MEDIKIITDTCSDLPEEIAEKYDIGIVRFLTIFGDKEYMNGKDITNKEFFEKLESFDGIPTSSQPPFQYLYDLLLEESKKHKTVIFFTMSSKASGEFQTANLIASQIKEDDNPDADIRIVDTEKLSVYIAQTAVYAAQLVRDGKTADEVIEESMKYIKTWRAYIVVDTLKYLEKGGRLSKSASIVGTLLDIKPILTVEGGLVDSYGKLRGKKKLVDNFARTAKGEKVLYVNGNNDLMLGDLPTADNPPYNTCEFYHTGPMKETLGELSESEYYGV